MTVSDQLSSLLSWSEPEGLNPRGTVVVIPGRGERPEVYERLGRRISSDAYRVHVVILFLERLRLGADLPPIAVREELREQR